MTDNERTILVTVGRVFKEQFSALKDQLRAEIAAEARSRAEAVANVSPGAQQVVFPAPVVHVTVEPQPVFNVAAPVVHLAPDLPAPTVHVRNEVVPSAVPVEVRNEVHPTPLTITNEVRPTPVEVRNEVRNDVHPTPVEVYNEVRPTPVDVYNEVRVNPTPITVTVDSSALADAIAPVLDRLASITVAFAAAMEETRDLLSQLVQGISESPAPVFSPVLRLPRPTPRVSVAGPDLGPLTDRIEAMMTELMTRGRVDGDGNDSRRPPRTFTITHSDGTTSTVEES